MNSIQFDITPYTITAVSLIIVGLASIVYLLHLKEKSTPSWIFIFGLASFTTITGTAQITYVDVNTIKWKIITPPDGEYYLPAEATLTRK